MTALTLLTQTANKLTAARQAAPLNTPTVAAAPVRTIAAARPPAARPVAAVVPVAAPVDPGHAAAQSSHLGFGSTGAGGGASGALTGGGGGLGSIVSALSGGMGGGGASPHPQILDAAPRVRGEEVRNGAWMGLHGAEMRAMSKARFDAGAGHSGATGAAPPAYTPTPGDGGGGIGGALPFTMPTLGGRREQGAPVRARAPRVARDITDVAAALPRMKARRGTKPTGI